MLDQRVARGIAGLTAVGDEPRSPYVPDGLETICRDAQERIEAHTGLRCPGPAPAPEAVDRTAWTRLAISDMAAMIDPVADRAAGGRIGDIARGAMGTVLAAEAGALTGYLSTRILGQYALVLTEPGAPARLLFVAPNIAQAGVRLGARADPLWTWIAVHEVTHAVQFEAVPWLRSHLAGLVSELLELLDADVDPRRLLRVPRPADVQRLAESVRENGIAGALGGLDGGRAGALLERLQTTMAVIEGHAEYVMDAVGEDVVEDLPQLREAMDHRRASRPPLLRLLERLVGLEAKMRQYADGRRFCDAVVAAGGVPGLHDVFAAPDALPDAAELADPAAWIARRGLA